jgi:hypothetical protein
MEYTRTAKNAALAGTSEIPVRVDCQQSNVLSWQPATEPFDDRVTCFFSTASA